MTTSQATSAVEPRPLPGVRLLANNEQKSDITGPGFDAFDMAQAFTTGDNPHSHTLLSVQLQIEQAAGAIRPRNYVVSIWTSNNNGRPHTRLGELTNPASPSSALYAFTTAGIDLGADTTYIVVLDSTDTSDYQWTRTEADAESGHSGWTVADNSLQRDKNSDSADDWTEHQHPQILLGDC